MTPAPPKDSTIINICIIPSDEVGKQCVGLSQSLESPGTAFVLDGVSKFAHMTVFMARFTDDNIPKVVAAAQQALVGSQPFLCTHTGYFMTAGRYLEASYRKSGEFMNLHSTLIDTLKPLRSSPGLPFEEGYFTPYTDEQRHNAETTGYDLAYGLYRPHITLTRYKEDQVPEIFPGFAPAQLNFQCHKVCVFKADNNGAVYEQLAEINL
ncbi:MAG TPA: 2'-5' RNA ligase family protein [Candidatus Acidoferrum sp.]|nr:2'-5' RNA ligase family protein [Candidatus Acidoferrum sp.]